jgi:hypothetical protein
MLKLNFVLLQRYCRQSSDTFESSYHAGRNVIASVYDMQTRGSKIYCVTVLDYLFLML